MAKKGGGRREDSSYEISFTGLLRIKRRGRRKEEEEEESLEKLVKWRVCGGGGKLRNDPCASAITWT